MKRAIVLYHSLFGNTKSVAMFLAKGIEETGVEVDCINIQEAVIAEIPEYDLIAIGGPTHMIRPSKEMKEFLERLKTIDLRGLLGFSFDTRNESRMNSKSYLILENSAARSIERSMKRMRMKILRPRASAIVNGREGPLENNTEETFAQIGRELGSLLAA
ncbi:MAG: flavodoxin family protein [Candidatus Thorarchaeota archaeon]